MQNLSVTRRVHMGGVEPENTELRGELFCTLARYGVIEEVCFEEDKNFHSGAAVVQFQRLSSSERLQSDMEGSERNWVINFLPPVVHVGPALLVTSPRLIDMMFVRSLLPKDINDVKIEEKMLSFPGSMSDEDTTTLSCTWGDKSKSVAPKDVFVNALALVKARAVGRFALVVTFASVHDANSFLTKHQMFLASSKELYVVHIGVNTLLEHALKHTLLTRCATKDVATGAILQGIVLPPRHAGATSSSSSSSCSMLTCEVDAGLSRKGKPILLLVQKNFIKVVPWDAVEVRVTSLDPGGCESFIDAVLRSVVNVRSVAVESQKSALILNRLRQQGSSSGPSLSLSSFFSATEASKKTLAGKLYQALHARKTLSGVAESSQLQSVGGPAERVHKFPKGFHVFSVVSVCVQRVGENGLHARMVSKPCGTSKAPSREWPVFVPSFFVPREGGMDWREFAVPGERMTVVLLFAAAVGGSEATLHFVASKREADMRRASALALALGTNSDNNGDNDSNGSNNHGSGNVAGSVCAGDGFLVGARFSASRAVWLPRTPGISCPVYILLPSSASPQTFFSVSIFLRAPGTAAGEAKIHSVEAMTADAGLHFFVISEILYDNDRGHYAVAEEEAVYRKMEAERRAAESRQEAKQTEFVRRILSEMLSSSRGGEASVNGRKRSRSPDL